MSTKTDFTFALSSRGFSQSVDSIPGIVRGAAVRRTQLLGVVGKSGSRSADLEVDTDVFKFHQVLQNWWFEIQICFLLNFQEIHGNENPVIEYVIA